MACFLNVQGFHLSSQFIFKEIALVSSDGHVSQTWTLKPPCKMEALSVSDCRTVKLVSNHVLQLDWNEGIMPYYSLGKIFELIGRQFKVWNVESSDQMGLLFPYKSLSVKIIEWLDTEIEIGDSDADIQSGKGRKSCIHNHQFCALNYAYQLYQKVKNIV